MSIYSLSDLKTDINHVNDKAIMLRDMYQRMVRALAQKTDDELSFEIMIDVVKVMIQISEITSELTEKIDSAIERDSRLPWK